MNQIIAILQMVSDKNPRYTKTKRLYSVPKGYGSL